MKKSFPHRSFIFAIATSSVAASLGLAAGIALETVKDQLIAFVPLIIAMPAMHAMASDYATIITAHIGDPEASKILPRKLAIALISALPISIIGVFVLSLFVASIGGYALITDSILNYGVFIAASLVSVVVIIFAVTVLFYKILNKRQQNTDDILIPANNIISSILMLGWFAAAAWFIF